MKQPALVPNLLALAIAVGTSLAVAPGCGGTTPAETGGSGGGGGETTTTTGGSGGGTTTMVSTECEALCAHLDSIDCSLLQNCATDCPNHLNAPADCTDEADALIACWAANLQDFACTQDGAVPPSQCSEEETVFNTCVGGGMPTENCLCSPGVGVKDDDSCSRKATCGTTEFNQTCQKLAEGEPWACTCLSNGGLLGTCTTSAVGEEQCSFEYGCCVPLFCAASSE